MEQAEWADRGQQVQLDAPEPASTPVCLGVSRLGSLQLGGSAFTVWVQLRGSAWIEAKEGRFRLRRGDWIALDKESRPQLQADRHGTTIGLALNADALRGLSRFSECHLYAGRGRMTRRDARTAVRLWREAAARLSVDPAAPLDPQALRPIVLHLAGVQRELSARLPRCPGRSRQRKRQVFGRLQRAHLYLQGNCDRVVRISELAELTSFSSWYFSKTFHSLYEESPQAASARMRLERAADLLHSTSMMIGEVAAACGFDNCCSFARAFRARFGMPASRYRALGARGVRAESANPPAVARKASLRTGT